MQRTQLPRKLQNILSDIPYATLSTVCKDGQPWNSPVFARVDDNLEVYWVSWIANQHSQNIARDPRIFVVIYDSRAPAGTGLGLYMQMLAQPLTNVRDVQAVQRRWHGVLGEAHDPTAFTGDNPRRIYRAIPQKIWHNTDGHVGGHFVDMRRQIWPA